MFGWLKRRRIEKLRASGLTIDVAALRELPTPPVCVLRVNLGWGQEHWAQFTPEPLFVPKQRVLAGGKLVAGDEADVERACAELGIRYERISVRF